MELYKARYKINKIVWGLIILPFWQHNKIMYPKKK